MDEVEELDKKFGFRRPCDESGGFKPLKLYHGHLLAFVTQDPMQWPRHAKDYHPFIKELERKVKHKQKIIKTSIIYDEMNTKKEEDGVFDLLYFDMNNTRVKIRNVKENMIDNVVKYVLDGDVDKLELENLVEDNTIFICSHNKNDQRCGFCGPIIFKEFEKLLDGNNKNNLYHISHVGGHKYAANVIVYPPGNWYGYIKPEDVTQLFLSLTNPDVKFDDKKLRGCMGKKGEKVKKLTRIKKKLSVSDIPLIYFYFILCILVILLAYSIMV